MRNLIGVVFTLVAFAMSGNVSAGIIEGTMCTDSHVTGTGYVNADDCIGLLDKDQPGAGPQDSEAFFNTAQSFSDGAEIWGTDGAFGYNDWTFLGKDDVDSAGYDFIDGNSGDPGTWTVDSALTGTYLIAVKQETELGLWLFSDFIDVLDGTFLIDDIFGAGFTDDNWSHISIYSAGERDVPEPGMVGLLAIGLLGMVVARRRMKI